MGFEKKLFQVPWLKIPTTEEEIEEFGSEDLRVNLSRELIDSVRKRKGLTVKEKVVQHAEKQRTLARKK